MSEIEPEDESSKLAFLAHALFCDECTPQIDVSVTEGGSWPDGCHDRDTYKAVLQKPWEWDLCDEGRDLMVTAIQGQTFAERFGGSSVTKCDDCGQCVGYDGERWTGGAEGVFCQECCVKKRGHATS